MQQQTSGHTIKAFDEDIERLRALISQMGGLAEHSIEEAMRCLVQRDIEGAEQVVADDKKLDVLEIETERRAVQLIALRAPMAADLRDVVAALKISGVVERIGDYAKNIAKRVMALNAEFPPPKLIRGVEHMTDMVLQQMKLVLDAYGRRDVSKAMAVWRGDEEIDAVNNSLFRELLTYMMEDPRNITFCTHLLFCAKNIERMGDHATNIAETVHYIIEGRPIADQRPKGDTTTIAALRSAAER